MTRSTWGGSFPSSSLLLSAAEQQSSAAAEAFAGWWPLGWRLLETVNQPRARRAHKVLREQNSSFASAPRVGLLGRAEVRS